MRMGTGPAGGCGSLLFVLTVGAERTAARLSQALGLAAQENCTDPIYRPSPAASECMLAGIWIQGRARTQTRSSATWCSVSTPSSYPVGGLNSVVHDQSMLVREGVMKLKELGLDVEA